MGSAISALEKYLSKTEKRVETLDIKLKGYEDNILRSIRESIADELALIRHYEEDISQ